MEFSPPLTALVCAAFLFISCISQSHAFADSEEVGSAVSAGHKLELEIVTAKGKLPRNFYYGSAVYDGFDSIYLLGGTKREVGSSYGAIYKYSISSDSAQTIGRLDEEYGAAAFTSGHIYYFGGE